ncbi:hypothetical protein GGR55DRAFT_472333 [Xylaria sp. FL0064]|nr:hypothetical protein GGR55DRAFT_472333 [Xylaria sp. FL0064]
MAKSHSNSPEPGGLKHSAATASTSFTPEMRDRQARGKNPYHSDSEDSDWAPGPGNGSGGEGSGSSSAQSNIGPARAGEKKPDDEPFAVYDRRRVASQILNNPELLVMAAVRDEQSIPATRLKYTRILCGVGEPSSGSRAKTTRPSSGGERPHKREHVQGGPRPDDDHSDDRSDEDIGEESSPASSE